MYIFETILKRSTKTLTVEYNDKYQVNVHIPTYWTSLCLWCSCGYAHCSECKPRLVSWSLWVHLIPATMDFCPLNPPWHDMAATHYCHAGSTTAWEPSWCAAQRFVRQKRRKILCEPSLNLEQLMVSKLRWKCFKWQGHKLPMFANVNRTTCAIASCMSKALENVQRASSVQKTFSQMQRGKGQRRIVQMFCSSHSRSV